jgi:hypothetical protein
VRLIVLLLLCEDAEILAGFSTDSGGQFPVEVPSEGGIFCSSNPVPDAVTCGSAVALDLFGKKSSSQPVPCRIDGSDCCSESLLRTWPSMISI